MISLFETARLSVSISLRNLYNPVIEKYKRKDNFGKPQAPSMEKGECDTRINGSEGKIIKDSKMYYHMTRFKGCPVQVVSKVIQ